MKEEHPDMHNWWGLLLTAVLATAIITLGATAVVALFLWLL